MSFFPHQHEINGGTFFLGAISEKKKKAQFFYQQQFLPKFWSDPWREWNVSTKKLSKESFQWRSFEAPRPVSPSIVWSKIAKVASKPSCDDHLFEVSGSEDAFDRNFYDNTFNSIPCSMEMQRHEETLMYRNGECKRSGVCTSLYYKTLRIPFFTEKENFFGVLYHKNLFP